MAEAKYTEKEEKIIVLIQSREILWSSDKFNNYDVIIKIQKNGLSNISQTKATWWLNQVH